MYHLIFSKKTIIQILLLLFVFTVYYFTSAGNTPYDYFVKLAVAFTKNQYYIVDNPPWLNELIPIGDNRYAVVYPPGPAIIIMPLVYIFGNDIPQQIIAHIFGALFTLMTAKLAFKITSNKKVAIWFFLLAAFGNITWYLSANGSVWYLGQIAGAFFLTTSIYLSLLKNRPILASVFLAMAFLSRIQTVLALPLIIYLNLKDNPQLIKLLKIGGPISIAFIFYGIYNYIRFGSFLETGYDLIPGVLDEPWYSHGIFHISYIKNNLLAMFASFPIIKNEFPYIIPSWGGLSIWITSPAFLFIIFSKLRNITNIVAWISIVMISIVTFTHGGTGFTQFGYRYAVDFYPLIFYLLADGIKNKGLGRINWILLVISMAVNAWGVIWINKFGWVSF